MVKKIIYVKNKYIKILLQKHENRGGFCKPRNCISNWINDTSKLCCGL